METPIFSLHQGTAPLLVSLPHDGSEIPDDIAQRLVPDARKAPDTDWWVSRLYAFAKVLGASVLVPRFSRYVVDLNRPPDDTSLYPGQNTTGLCPIVQFSGVPVYAEGSLPDAGEIANRVDVYWRPYHQALQGELKRIRDLHGRAVVWEGHSIRGELPFLFDGRLPDFNLGTVGGASCRPELQQRLETVLQAQDGYTHVVNGRFKGGYITRHYADPANDIDAVQLELAQRTYMDEQRVEWDDLKAQRLQRVLQALLETALA
ncbi:MAG: N-formylglutamate deformylase [Xanthomonadales bacterium]|nr:N-formylglutamate deformylase [Xanthomonadales bacterium]